MPKYHPVQLGASKQAKQAKERNNSRSAIMLNEMKNRKLLRGMHTKEYLLFKMKEALNYYVNLGKLLPFC